jgi:hypothetical protein
VTKTGVKRFLALFFAILYGAIFLRIDYFPLSWVPMYGYRLQTEHLTVKFGDKSARDRGFLAQRANGQTLYVSADDLNVPSANFRRLYNQRAFNVGPPQDARERVSLMSFNRWWYETFVGPDPRLNPNYSGQLLESVNKTFGYAPNDPRRIVRLEAEVDLATYERQHVDAGDLSNPSVERGTAIITEKGSFLKRGDKISALTRGAARDAGPIE